jgi:hypothetical protein
MIANAISNPQQQLMGFTLDPLLCIIVAPLVFRPETKLFLMAQECGPRFVLKLLTLQHGTFDTKSGEYEWVHKVLMLLLLLI